MDNDDKQRRRDSIHRKRKDREKRHKSPAPPIQDDFEVRGRPRKKKWDVDEFLDNEDQLDWEPM